MQVNPNDGVGRIPQPAKAGAPRPRPSDASITQFNGSEALNRAMDKTPDIRADQVKRARGLIGDVKYPPTETIHRIASLLAIHIASDE